MIALFLFVNAAVQATSVVMEARRGGNELAFRLWDPFVWEYTSVISILLLIPILHWLLEKQVLDWSKLKRSISIFFIAAVCFSLAHVSLMVGMRKLVYQAQARTYEFGPLFYELLYEFRKDILTFTLIIILIYSYRFIVSRLLSEANLVAEENYDSAFVKSRDRLLVKKLGKEFIVKLEDVEWMESSGNYVNLHIRDRIYPIRKTLASFTKEIADKGFCRVHRSHAINLDSVESITPLASGDGEVKLKSGKVLNISRRYKDELKQRLL